MLQSTENKEITEIAFQKRCDFDPKDKRKTFGGKKNLGNKAVL